MSPYPHRANQGPRAHPCFVPVSPTQRRLQCLVASEIVAAFLGISAQDILSRLRARADIAHARHTAMYLSHVAFQLPLLLVAEGFGRDRSSVAYALQRIEDERDDLDFDRLLTRMETLARACRRLTVPTEDSEGF